MSGLAKNHKKMLETDSNIPTGLITTRGYFTATTADQIQDLGFSAAQSQAPALVIPLHGVDGGDPIGYQIRSDNPRIKDGKPVKYETPLGAVMRIDVPPCVREHLDDPDVPLWITEGVKKADCAASKGLCCIDLLGVWNWRGKNFKGGTVELADWNKVAIKGRTIYLAFDNDVTTKPQVLQALRELAAFLKRKKAKKVLPILIPGEDPEKKLGLDDYFAAGGTVRELKDSVDESLLDSHVIIVNGRQLREVTADTLEAIVASNDPPSVFVRAGKLVRIETDERSLSKIRELTPSTLRNIATNCSLWGKRLKDDITPAFPPLEVMENVLAQGAWPDFPAILNITKAPVLAPDYTLSSEPGYDPKTLNYVATNEAIPDWEGSAQDALDFIFGEVLVDFPFAGAADQAHALALMLLPIVRPIISGPTPLHLIGAPVQGSGKSLLAKICLMPTMGESISATTGTRDEEEWRKKILASLLEGKPYLFLDNLTRKVDSETLAGVLTSTEWNDRALGLSENINVPVRSIWIATANNVELSRDILRRTVWIHLDAGVERPEDRSGFKHKNIEKWVVENRPRIISALCCLIKSWIASGSPLSEGKKLGSFEEWSRTIGGILQSLNFTDFLANITELRKSASDEDESWKEFYSRWYNLFYNREVRVSEILECYEEDEALAGMLGDRGGESGRKHRLGHIIKRRVGVIAGIYRIVRAQEFRGSRTYKLEKVEPQPNLAEVAATDQVVDEVRI